MDITQKHKHVPSTLPATNEDSKDNEIKRPFICPFNDCSKQFSESGNLKTHMRIHVLLFTF